MSLGFEVYFSLMAVGALNISDTPQERVMSFLVLANERAVFRVLTNELLGLGKQNNYRQVQKLSILSVCNYPECFRGLLSSIVQPMRGQYSDYWPIRSPGADTMKWLNWHHLWETYFVFETPILLCDARSTLWQEVDAAIWTTDADR